MQQGRGLVARRAPGPARASRPGSGRGACRAAALGPGGARPQPGAREESAFVRAPRDRGGPCLPVAPAILRRAFRSSMNAQMQMEAWGMLVLRHHVAGNSRTELGGWAGVSRSILYGLLVSSLGRGCQPQSHVDAF